MHPLSSNPTHAHRPQVQRSCPHTRSTHVPPLGTHKKGFARAALLSSKLAHATPHVGAVEAPRPHASLLAPLHASPTEIFVCMHALQARCVPDLSCVLTHHCSSSNVLFPCRLELANCDSHSARSLTKCPCMLMLARMQRSRVVPASQGNGADGAIWAPPGGCGTNTAQHCACLPTGTSVSG